MWTSPTLSALELDERAVRGDAVYGALDDRADLDLSDLRAPFRGPRGPASRPGRAAWQDCHYAPP